EEGASLLRHRTAGSDCRRQADRDLPPDGHLQSPRGKGQSMTAWGDLTVIDASETVAGQYCGRLFAGYGADVTLIEPTGGSVIRRVGPFSQKFGDSTAF